MTSSLERADHITTAMLSRGYQLDQLRTRYRPLKLGWREGIAFVVVMVAISPVWVTGL
jgi:energy-coupling factor transporter transmembrane protein EcfT